MKLYALIILNFLFAGATAQTVEQLNKSGDSAYFNKNYTLAVEYYNAVLHKLSPGFVKGTAYYNLARSYSQQKNSSAAWQNLNSALKNGYTNYEYILKSSEFKFLKADTKKWQRLTKKATKAADRLHKPGKAKLITTDIHNFWEAYDAVQKDTASAISLYTQLYFNRASAGLMDYYRSRIYSVRQFVANQNTKKKFYAAIKENTLRVDAFKKQMRQSFKKFKKIYPQALFPDVYFVIGRWNSAGTVSDNGLLIGTDMMSKSDAVPQDELSGWESGNYKSIENLPYIVAHELVHYEQDSMAYDTTTLSSCIKEGMADFIGELISGKNSNPRLHIFAKGKEKLIWADFEKEMFLARTKNWIANAAQETANKPADLGYWIGYQICKAYYDEINNPPKAIYDMLHIKDYKAFLQKSMYKEKVQLMQ